MTISTNKKKYLFIIAGASGEIGAAFIKQLAGNFPIIGISRTNELDSLHKNLSWIHCDLTRHQDVEKAFSEKNFSIFEKVFLIHSIGLDKFENTNYPAIEPLETIDPTVYNSNVNTYKYIAATLMDKISRERKAGSKTKLVLSMIGSVADKHGVIFLTSFSESKNIVRAYIQFAVREHKWISGLIINISSTITKSALGVRPYADTTYWLNPIDVVRKSAATLLKTKRGYNEIDIYKKDPNYDPDYYKNNEKIFSRWSHFVWGIK